MNPTVTALDLKLAFSTIVQEQCGQTTVRVLVVPKALAEQRGFLVVIPLEHRREVYRFVSQRSGLGQRLEGDDALTVTQSEAAQIVDLSTSNVPL